MSSCVVENKKEISEKSLDIMSESVEFIKNRNIANMTNKDIM